MKRQRTPTKSKKHSRPSRQVERVVRRRPKTRGELIDCLKRGVECEIVASNEQTTNIVLDGWLNFAGKYKTRPSENVGWIIYVAA